MKLSRLTLFLIITCALSFLLFLISLFTVQSDKKNSVQSALLNPLYRDKIQTIIIQSQDEVLTLKKNDGNWFCQSRGITAAADSKTVDTLLKNLTKIRIMYKISDRLSAKSELNLTEESADIITLIDKSQNAVSKLYFGSADSLTSRISAASDKGKTSWETQNDLSTFLTSDINFWCESEIFYFIKNPSNLSFSSDELYSLKSLRHGNIAPDNHIPQKAVPVNSITLYGQYESSQRLDFYREDTAQGVNYYYTQKNTPSDADENAVYEISSFTYDKIMSLIK